MSKPKTTIFFGRNSKVTCLLLLWHPAYRRRGLTKGVYMERENLSSQCEEKTSSKRHCKKESTDVRHGGGNFRSSDEVLVMRMERRGVVIWFLIMDEN